MACCDSEAIHNVVVSTRWISSRSESSARLMFGFDTTYRIFHLFAVVARARVDCVVADWYVEDSDRLPKLVANARSFLSLLAVVVLRHLSAKPF